jgi:amino acid transporter
MLAAAIVNGVVGGGIFSLPAAMADAAGTWAPAIFLICALIMGAVVLCFAEASARVASSGGAAACADAAFGPFVAFLTGLMLWVSAVLACGGIAAAMADGLLPWLPVDDSLVRAGLIVTVIGGLALINILGVGVAARAVGFLTIIKLAPLLLLVAVGGWALLDGGAIVEAVHVPAGHFGSALLLALFAFSGMETPLGASGEVARPERTIPRALFMAMGGVSLLYIAIQLVCQGLLGNALAASAAPLSDSAGRLSPALGALLLLGASISRLAWIGSDLIGAPRFLLGFARDGTAPALLGRVHRRTHTPWVAVLVHAGIAMLLALTGTFEPLAILAGLTTAPIYLVVCLAAWRLRRRSIQMSGPPPRLAFATPAVVVGIAGMVAIIALATRGDQIGLALLLGGGSLYYGAVRAIRQRQPAWRQARRPDL